MKRAFVVLAVLLGCVASGAVGYWFGFRDAYPLGVMADAAPRGAIALHHLKALSLGRLDRLAMAFEFDVDNGLIWSHYLEEAPLHEHWATLWGIPNAGPNEYLTRLADYRKTHPSLMNPDALGVASPNAGEEERAFRAAQLASARETAAILNNMVERYATKP
jgi:hypothetical protein